MYKMILLLLLAIPIYLLLMCYIRLLLEFVIVVFKIAETPHNEEKGILKSLFDTNFDMFLAPRLIKIIYKIFLFGLPIILLVWLVSTIFGAVIIALL